MVIEEYTRHEAEMKGDDPWKWGSAKHSEDGHFRFSLARTWVGPDQYDPDATKKWIAFCMLNPSTASAFKDDPTIKRCCQFARREGAHVVQIVNLFPNKSTNPDDLQDTYEAGIDVEQWLDNKHAMWAAAAFADVVIAAWGSHPMVKVAEERALMLLSAFRPVMCLGRTKDNHPKHPLYLRKDTPLEVYCEKTIL